MSHTPTGRPRGAPHGNQNNLRHGIYSRHISIQAEADVDSMPHDQNQDELALARARLVACLEKQKDAPPEDWLIYERAISHYLLAIATFIRNNAVLGRDQKTSAVTVLEMIRQVNERENVS
jgi:hypothetical protein